MQGAHKQEATAREANRRLPVNSRPRLDRSRLAVIHANNDPLGVRSAYPFPGLLIPFPGLLLRFRVRLSVSGSTYPFPGPLIRFRVCLSVSGADAEGRPFGVCQSPNRLSSLGRIVIVSPIRRKCLEVVVVAVDKIAERCEQATASKRQRWFRY